MCIRDSYLTGHELATPDDRILLTVSGGVDPLVMLSLFVHSGYRVGVAHCNFQLRGSESEEYEALVQREAERWGVPVSYTHLDVYKRQLRYGVLQHGLARAERPRDKARTALGQRVERVDRP